MDGWGQDSRRRLGLGLGLGSGPQVVGRLGSGLWVCASFQLHIYIYYWLMVVVVGECLTPCKKGGIIVRAGEMSGGVCLMGKCLGRMSYILVSVQMCGSLSL